MANFVFACNLPTSRCRAAAIAAATVAPPLPQCRRQAVTNVPQSRCRHSLAAVKLPPTSRFCAAATAAAAALPPPPPLRCAPPPRCRHRLATAKLQTTSRCCAAATAAAALCAATTLPPLPHHRQAAANLVLSRCRHCRLRCRRRRRRDAVCWLVVALLWRCRHRLAAAKLSPTSCCCAAATAAAAAAAPPSVGWLLRCCAPSD